MEKLRCPEKEAAFIMFLGRNANDKELDFVAPCIREKCGKYNSCFNIKADFVRLGEEINSKPAETEKIVDEKVVEMTEGKVEVKPATVTIPPPKEKATNPIKG